MTNWQDGISIQESSSVRGMFNLHRDALRPKVCFHQVETFPGFFKDFKEKFKEKFRSCPTSVGY